MLIILTIFPVWAAAAHGGGNDHGGSIASRSLTFADAADLAVFSSADLRGEYRWQGIREKAWTLGFRSYLPRLSLNAQENDRLQEIGADSFIKSYSVSIDQLLWDGGRLPMSRKLDRMELNLSGSRLERMAAGIAESALSAYRGVLSSRTILSIRKAALEFLCGQREILAKELELGLALPVDLAEADLALLETRIEILALESDLAEMERQFAELLGLDVLPPLGEEIDIKRAAVLPSATASVSLAEEKNPELAEARFSIVKRQGELQYASRSWIPTLRLNGSFGLTGREYPLNRYTWSLGLTVEFSNPWIQNTFAFQRGWESPNDQTANMQNTFSPLPDPAASLGKRQAELALTLEKERYSLLFERTGRSARRALEKCRFADRKRGLAVEAIDLAARRYSMEEVRLDLGQITRLELMEARIAYTGKEIAAVESAMGLMQAERELERILDLRPGELAVFALSYTPQTSDMAWPAGQILFGERL